MSESWGKGITDRLPKINESGITLNLTKQAEQLAKECVWVLSPSLTAHQLMQYTKQIQRSCEAALSAAIQEERETIAQWIETDALPNPKSPNEQWYGRQLRLLADAIRQQGTG